MAHSGVSISHKAQHNCRYHAKKKFKKQQRLLQENIVPTNLSFKLLSTQEIDEEIIVFDGGNKDNPPLRPPDGLIWRCISITNDRHIYVDDETNPALGLTFA